MIPVTQGGLAGLLVLFWFLFGGSSEGWIPVAFYLLGLIMGILLISQFWTLANDIFDARQAKRLFGFIGARVGARRHDGRRVDRARPRAIGTQNLLLLSAAVLALLRGHRRGRCCGGRSGPGSRAWPQRARKKGVAGRRPSASSRSPGTSR